MPQTLELLKKTISIIIPLLWKYFLYSLHLDEVLLRLLRPKNINCIYCAKLENGSVHNGSWIWGVLNLSFQKSWFWTQSPFKRRHTSSHNFINQENVGGDHCAEEKDYRVSRAYQPSPIFSPSKPQLLKVLCSSVMLVWDLMRQSYHKYKHHLL